MLKSFVVIGRLSVELKPFERSPLFSVFKVDAVADIYTCLSNRCLFPLVFYAAIHLMPHTKFANSQCVLGSFAWKLILPADD